MVIFHDRSPASRVHLLAVPKRHIGASSARLVTIMHCAGPFARIPVELVLTSVEPRRTDNVKTLTSSDISLGTSPYFFSLFALCSHVRLSFGVDILELMLFLSHS